MENLTSSQVTDLRQSPAYGQYMQRIGWKTVAVSPNIQVFIRPLGILGSIAKIQRVSLLLSWAKTDKVLKKHRVWMTKLEPVNSLPAPRKFRQDKWPLLATKTLCIDISPPLEKIKQGFKKDARYCLKKATMHKLQISFNHFEAFYHLWKKSAQIKKLWIPPYKDFKALIECFGSNCFCVMGNDSAGALVLIHDQVAYYYYAAALPTAKRQLLPYAIVWKCMQNAKRLGCKTWDWEGIFDPRWPTNSWRGFTHFKKSFGGDEVSFPGSFTRWF